MRFQPQKARRVRKHRLRVRLGKTLALQHLQEHRRVPARHVSLGLALGRRIAEMLPAIDHLFGRPATDTKLQATTGDEIGRASILDHIERIFVAHVDDASAHLDLRGPRADGRQQWERRGKLCAVAGRDNSAPLRAAAQSLCTNPFRQRHIYEYCKGG